MITTLNPNLIFDVADSESGLADMRISYDGITWTEWEPFGNSISVKLEDTDKSQTIFTQVRDKAGNESEIMSASTIVNLNQDSPSSASYTIPCSVHGAGAGKKTSSSYKLTSTIGQIHETGQLTSGSYKVNSGFWGCASSQILSQLP